MNGKSKKNTRQFQIIAEDTPFTYKEAFKSLRTNINFLAGSNNYKRIVVTSAIAGEGKSGVSVNLSVSLAEMGKKVLLIDCDLRRPVVHKYLRIDNSIPGLTALLCNEAKAESAIVRFTDLGVDVIAAGVMPPNPAELLGSKRMEALLDYLDGRYDYIILDTPPVSAITDAAVLGRFADGAVLVVRANYVKIEQTLLAKKNLLSAGVNILGAILNCVDPQNKAYNGKYSYDYEYK